VLVLEPGSDVLLIVEESDCGVIDVEGSDRGLNVEERMLVEIVGVN